MRMIFGLVFVSISFLLAGCSDPSQQLANGETAPGFDLPTLAGKRSGLPLPGQVVAIRFWADWCPFCEGEMSELEPVYRRLKGRGLVLLAVNVRQDPDTARRFVEHIGISYGSLLDREGEVARRYGVIGLPTTFFVDREGRLAGRILGESTPEVFTAMVEKLLAPVPEPQDKK